MPESSNLIRRRAYVKGLITHDINKIKGLTDEELSKHLLSDFIQKINSNLLLVEDFDISLGEEIKDEELEAFVASNRDYHFEIQKTLSEFKLKFDRLFSENNIPEKPSKLVKLPLPPIQINPFENNASNPFACFNFKNAFLNA